MTLYVLFSAYASSDWKAVCTIEGETAAQALDAQGVDDGRYMVVPLETVEQFTVTHRPHVESGEVGF